MTISSHPFASAPGDGERIDIGSATFLVRATAASTAGALSIFEEEPPLLDTPRHVHRAMDETFYVLAGEHEFVCGEEQLFRSGFLHGAFFLFPASEEGGTYVVRPQFFFKRG